MLKYEEMLHFDENYKKLQEGKWLQIVVCLFWSIVVYILAYYLLRCVCSYVPDQGAWNQTEKLYRFGNIQLGKVDFIYFMGGLIAFIYSSIRLTRIMVENHSVRNHGRPNRVLTDGYYSKVRHPMYGTFIMMYSAILLSIHSMYGLIVTLLIVVGQYLNAYIEEQKLHSLFQEEYEAYCSKTKVMLISKVQGTVIVVIFLLTIVGLNY